MPTLSKNTLNHLASVLHGSVVYSAPQRVRATLTYKAQFKPLGLGLTLTGKTISSFVGGTWEDVGLLIHFGGSFMIFVAYSEFDGDTHIFILDERSMDVPCTNIFESNGIRSFKSAVNLLDPAVVAAYNLPDGTTEWQKGSPLTLAA